MIGRYVEVYNPKNDSWSALTPQPSAVLGGVAAAVTSGLFAPKRIYIFSGSKTQIYNPSDNTLIKGAPMSSSRDKYSVAVVNDILFVIGGQIVNYEFPSMAGPSTVTPFAINEQYTPLGYGTIPPKVSPQLLMNQTYNESSVPLVFSVDKTVDWIGYSLDGKENVTIAGNTTLTPLSGGIHNITIYANDTFGNMAASQTTTFTVSKPVSFLSVPTATVAAISGAIAIAVVAGLLVYFKKHTQSSLVKKV